MLIVIMMLIILLMMMIRDKIKKELYQIENKKNLSDEEKEKIYDDLLELGNKLNKKNTGIMTVKI